MRSDVTIFCQEKLYKMLIAACKENSFEPNRIMKKKDGNTYNYRLDWHWVKWYDTRPEVRAIDRILILADEEEAGALYDYKQLLVGEDGAFEIYEHGDTFEEVFMEIKILYDEDNYEEYIEHFDYSYEQFYNMTKKLNKEWKGGLTEKEIAIYANEYKESYYASLSNGKVVGAMKEICKRVSEHKGEVGEVYGATVNDMVNILATLM